MAARPSPEYWGAFTRRDKLLCLTKSNLIHALWIRRKCVLFCRNIYRVTKECRWQWAPQCLHRRQTTSILLLISVIVVLFFKILILTFVVVFFLIVRKQ
jgi:hypothetical protein